MTASLNITYQGRSGTVAVGATITDQDARSIATEVLRTGGLEGMHHPRLADRELEHFVVDRFHENGETVFYLRPKVPFGDVERVL